MFLCPKTQQTVPFCKTQDIAYFPKYLHLFEKIEPQGEYSTILCQPGAQTFEALSVKTIYFYSQVKKTRQLF